MRAKKKYTKLLDNILVQGNEGKKLLRTKGKYREIAQ